MVLKRFEGPYFEVEKHGVTGRLLARTLSLALTSGRITSRSDVVRESVTRRTSVL